MINKPSEKGLRDVARNIRYWILYLEKVVKELKQKGERPSLELAELLDKLQSAYMNMSDALQRLSELDSI